MDKKQGGKTTGKDSKTGLVQERVPLDSILPDPANARRHGARNLETISNSLRYYGQVEPLLVQAATRKIIGGNGRYEAMKALGWKDAVVTMLDISDMKATALGIALNRTAELAEWDKETLRSLTETLAAHADEVDIESIGFDESELEALLKQHRNDVPSDGKEYDEDAAADVKMTSCPECGHEFPL